MIHSRSAVHTVLGCTLLAPALLAPAFLAFNRAQAAPASVSPPATVSPTLATLHIGVSAVGNTITFTPSAGVSAVRIQITSARGAQLYNSGWMTGFDAGLDAVTWQALDDKGDLLPAGLYLTQVEVRGVDGTIKTESGSLQLDPTPIATKDVAPRATTITGAGTPNRVVLWLTASTVGDSIITQTSSSALSVAGSLTVTNTITTKAVNATNNSGNALVGNSNSGTALAGITQTGNGVLGTSTSSNGMRGVTGTGIGVRGDSNNATIGVQGNSNAAPSGSNIAVGVDGNATGSSFSTYGVRGTSKFGIGVGGQSNSGRGVSGASPSGIGVYGQSDSGIGVSGSSGSTADGATAIVGTITSTSPGIDSAGVSGINNSTSDKGVGVYGSQAGSGFGVYGNAPSGYGVIGDSDKGVGVFGSSLSGNAGYFQGNVKITGNLSVDGTLSKGGGSFRIDDPLDPANKYLYHSFVESPDMMNLYNGTTTLDKQGRAIVTMPTYFSALNRDFRYQLTPIGAPSPNLYVLREIKNNTFEIAGGKPGLKVSWMVTGVRRDPWANDNRIPTQQLKTGAERGRYLYPAGYHKPANMGIDHLVAKPPLPKLGISQVATKPAVKHSAPPRVAQAK